jgi:hypothetical protein
MKNNRHERREPLYQQVRTAVLKGAKHMPYNEYIKERTLYYLQHLATDSDLEQAQKVIDDRLRLPL